MNSQENQEEYSKMMSEKDPMIMKELMEKWREDRISHPLFVQRILDLGQKARVTSEKSFLQNKLLVSDPIIEILLFYRWYQDFDCHWRSF